MYIYNKNAYIQSKKGKILENIQKIFKKPLALFKKGYIITL